MRLATVPLALLALAAAALLAPGCGGGGGGGGGGAPVPAVSGMVLRYTEEPFPDAPLTVLGGGPVGATRIDGLVLLGPVATGPRVLRIGDSVNTPTLLVPFDVAADAFLSRPIYLPALASGVGANLPATVAVLTSVAGSELPAVSLELAPGTAVSLPSGAAGQVRVVAVSPSRLPVALPGGAAARAGFLVEPFGTTFTPSATLRIPRLDPTSAGPFDAWQVSPATGQWEPLQSNVPLGPDGASFAVTVTQGTLVAVAPRAAAPTATLTGRVIAGTQPVAGFRVEVWGRTSDPTGVDGRFVITSVPTSYGVFYARAYPARPGVDFAPEVTLLTAASTNLGDVSVSARSPDSIAPTVRSASPTDGQLAVEPNTQVVVVFSEPIDRVVPSPPVRLTGRAGEVPTRVTFDNGFTVRLVPTRLLELDDQFSIVIDRQVRDLAGNRLDDSSLVTTFATRNGAPAAPPTDTLAFTVSPLTASRGATVSVLGRNFTGGTAVTFGATAGLVTSEAADEIKALVPDFQPAGDVTVGLSAGGTAVPVLRPLVLDLRAEVAAVLSGSAAPVPLKVVDRTQPPLQVVVDGGNIGGTAVTVEGLGIAAVDSTAPVGGATVATGRTLSIGATPPATLLTGPVVVRGSNGRAAPTYRFLFVREGP